jgi:lysophospholipid acyltransferase (LPLAT)-like uncharacterized protein
MKKGIKPIRDRLLLFLASCLGPILIGLLGKTLKIQWVGKENLDLIRKENKAVVYAFWHGRMLVFTYSHRKRKIHVLISQHRDGEYIARIIHRLGFVSVRGSTTRGGSKALFEMCDKTAAGFDVAVSPDGPKGPGFRVHPGIIYVAQRSGMPIVPISNSAENRWNLSSWDRFLIPKPFSKTVIMLGEPIYVAPESTPEQLEEKRRELEQRLLDLTDKADNYFLRAD